MYQWSVTAEIRDGPAYLADLVFVILHDTLLLRQLSVFRLRLVKHLHHLHSEGPVSVYVVCAKR